MLETILLAAAAALLQASSRACATYIDVEAPIVRNGSNSTAAKYFGYSVAPYANANGKWILVGAPRDDSDGVERFGALYRCKLVTDAECEPFTGYPPLLREFDDVDSQTKDRDQVYDQWLGVSVAAKLNGIVVTCAHRYIDFTKNFHTSRPIGRCLLFDFQFKFLSVLAPCKYRTIGVTKFDFCQSGSGLSLSDDGNAILLGNPGTFDWQGNVDVVDSKSYGSITYSLDGDRANGSNYQYLAYSVTFGSFKFRGNTNEFAVGVPRANHYNGQVIIFSYDIGSNSPIHSVNGSEAGAYFSHSLVAVDLNRDGFDDLIVGAPYYTGVRRDQGRVYTYINTQKSDFESGSVLTGPLARGSFGYAIATVGDVNMDGFIDIVVGAPFADDPTVYLYTTSLSGLVDSPLQVIHSSSLNVRFAVPGFGAALAGAVDLDDNGYPDIVVGAFLAEKTVVLRSKPVVAIVAALKLIPQYLIYKETERFEVELCMKYAGVLKESFLNVEFEVELDAEHSKRGFESRASFNGTAMMPKRAGKRRIAAQFVCQTFPATLQANLQPLASPMVVNVTYGLPPEAKVPSSDGNPILRGLAPVLRSNATVNVSESAYFRLSGVSDLRVVDVAVRSGHRERKISSVLLGDDTLIRLNARVENWGEAAYDAKVKVAFTNELKIGNISLNRTPISCRNETKGFELIVYLCDVGDPLAWKGRVDLEFVLLLADVALTTTGFNFTIEAESLNPENGTLNDNIYATPFISLIKNANFGIAQGISTPNRVVLYRIQSRPAGLNSSDVSRSISHSYYVQNRGPSPVPATVVTIAWPLRTSDNQYLLRLTGVEVSGPGQCNAEELGLIDRALVSAATVSTLHAIPTSESLDECGVSFYQTSCVTFQCNVSRLNSGDEVDIKVQARIFKYILPERYDDVAELSSVAVIRLGKLPSPVEVATGSDSLLKKFVVTTRVVRLDESTKEEMWWILPLIIVSSLVFLGLVVALMKCMGFFERPDKEKLAQEKKKFEQSE